MRTYILLLMSFLLPLQLSAQQNQDTDKKNNEEKYEDDISGRSENEAQLQGQLPGKEFNYARARWDAYLQLQQKLGTDNQKVENINGNWSFIGPYAITSGLTGTGRVNAIEVISKTKWLVATAQGGLWKTTNAGSTWTCLTDGLPNLSITDVDVDPHNSNVIYILTGDQDGSHSSQEGPPGIGILKSTNGGVTWLSTGMFFNRDEQFFGSRIEVDPNNGNRIWATIKDGIYESEDGGLTFNLSKAGGFEDLELMPGNPDFVLASGSFTIWYRESADSGWVKSTGLESVSNVSRLKIAYAPSNPNKVYAAYADTGSHFYRIYRSFDGGKNFSEFDAASTDIFSGQAYYDMALTVDPENENTVYAGGIWVYKSTDEGNTWTQYSCQTCDDLPYAHPDIHILEFTPDDVLLIGNDGGIYRSFEDTILDLSKGLYITQLYHLTSLTSNLSVIGAGAQDNGALIKKAGEVNFENLQQVDGMETFFVNEDSVFFTEGMEGRLYLQTKNNGRYNISPESDGSWDAPLIQDPNDPNTVYLCFDTIYRIFYLNTFDASFTSMIAKSPNQTTIDEAEIGISNTNRFYTFEKVTVEIDSTNNDYYGVLNRSDNFQDPSPVFNLVYISQDFYLLTDIVVDPANSLRIWITIGGYSDGSKVYYSEDGGAHFTNVSGSLPNVPVFCISYAPGSDDGLYVGTDIGVFYKDNSMSDWIPFQNGLPVVSVREIEIIPDDELLRVATLGRGIWQSAMFTGECDAAISILDGQYDEGLNVVQVSALITSVAKINGGIGTNVTYDCGEAIYLYEGFEVKSPSVFTAKIDGCDHLEFKYAELSGTYGGPMTGNQLTSQTSKPGIRIGLYPNPANSQVTAEFTIESESKVSIYIVDEFGRVLKCLAHDELFLPGKQHLAINTHDLAAGMYAVQLYSTSGKGFERLDVIR